MKSMPACKPQSDYEDLHMDAVGGRFIPPPPPPGPPPSLAIGVPPPPPPGAPPSKTKSPANRKSGQSIVEERRRAAMAMYQSADMVPDAPLPILVVKSPVVPLSASLSSSQSPKENRAPSSTASRPAAPNSLTKNKSPRRRMSINTKVEEGNDSPKTPSSSSQISVTSSGKNEGKQGFFRGMLGRKRSSPAASPIRPLAASRSPSPRQPRARGTKKKELERKLGMPLDAKPGSSYRSTPHSAEIVPRTPTRDINDVAQGSPSTGETKHNLNVMTTDEQLDAGIHAMESFSPPSFGHSPIHDYFPSNQFSEMKFHDDISILTDPSYAEPVSLPKKTMNMMEAIGEDEASVDPPEQDWKGVASKSSASKSTTNNMADTRDDPAPSMLDNNQFGDQAGARYDEEWDDDSLYFRESPRKTFDTTRDVESAQNHSAVDNEFSIPQKNFPVYDVNQIREEARRRSLLSDDETSAAQSHLSTIRSGNSGFTESEHSVSADSHSSPIKRLAQRKPVISPLAESIDYQTERGNRSAPMKSPKSFDSPAARSIPSATVQSPTLFDSQAARGMLAATISSPKSFDSPAARSMASTTGGSTASVDCPSEHYLSINSANSTESPYSPTAKLAALVIKQRRMSPHVARAQIVENGSVDVKHQNAQKYGVERGSVQKYPHLATNSQVVANKADGAERIRLVYSDSGVLVSKSSTATGTAQRSPRGLGSPLAVGNQGNRTQCVGNASNDSRLLPSKGSHSPGAGLRSSQVAKSSPPAAYQIGMTERSTRALHPSNQQSKVYPEEMASGAGTPISTKKALDLLRCGRKARTESPPPPSKPAVKLTTKPRAYEILRNKEIRPVRSRPEPPRSPPVPMLSAVKSPSAIGIRKHSRTRAEPLQLQRPDSVIPARASTLPQLSKLARQGRKPSYVKAVPKAVAYEKPRPKIVRKVPKTPTIAKPKAPTYYVKKRDHLIESHVVYIGISAIHRERRKKINEGIVVPFVPGVMTKTTNSSVAHAVDESTMDPIQRAGYRLLSKAAVPIQTEIRRFLAQREAVDRMWALIELQSYFRRWISEAYRYAHKWAVVSIQSAFRGWRARDKLAEEAFASIVIQRVVRGYLAAIRVYDQLYSVIAIQSVSRGWIGRTKARQRLGTVIILQSCCRRFLAKMKLQECHEAATVIQSSYRGYSAQLHFQFDLVDVIIVQSIVRRWHACKIASSKREDQRELAAMSIQTAWRGYQAYSNYVFSIADVLIAQRTARGWLSRREVQRMRREKLVIKIQSHWRRYKSQMASLYKLVHLIIVQSVVRRRLAVKKVSELRLQASAALTLQTRWRVVSWVKGKKCQDAATTIQAAWRRFWEYSHFLILNYEVIRIQSYYRGHRARREANLQMGCAIIIQSMMRRLLGFKQVQHLKLVNVLVAAGYECLRDNCAARRIQCFWITSSNRKRELHAAAVIHRFFAMVKVEVDREISRQKDRLSRRKVGKSKKKSRSHHEADDKMLERAWLNTVDDDPYGRSYRIHSRARCGDSETGMLLSVPTGSGYQKAVRDQGKPNLAGNAVDVRPFDEVSEVTSPTVYNKVVARVNTLSRQEMSEDLSLEEAWIDTEVSQVKKRRQAEQEYLQRHGLQYHGSYQHPSGRYYASSPHPMQEQRFEMHSPRRQQSSLPHQVASMRNMQGRHPSPNNRPLPVMHPPSGHDMRYSVPHGPINQNRYQYDNTRERRSSSGHSSVEKPRYSDPGYYGTGEPLRRHVGAYARHESPIHSTSPGYTDYPPQDRSGYYRS